MGRNKNVQEKLRKEINDNVDVDGCISYEKLMDLPYLDQVFHEALRLHPPEIFTSRECTEAIELEGVKGKKYLMEKDSTVIIPIYSIHHDSGKMLCKSILSSDIISIFIPEHYPDPDAFHPERFDPENGGLKSYKDKGVYLPFGDGPRICLGMRFALLQSKAAIVEIVKNFEISVNNKTAKDLVIDPQEYMNIKTGGLWLDFKLIDK